MVKVLSTVLSMGMLNGCSKTPVFQSTPLHENVAYTAVAESGLVYALPQSFITVDASWSGKATDQPQVTITDPQALPDKTYRYVLSSNLNAFSYDDFDLTVKSGLLASVNSTTDDQTQEALTTLVDAAIEAQKIAVARQRDADSRAQGGIVEAQPFDVTVTFDPFERASLANAVRRLSHFGLELSAGDMSGHAFSSSTVASQAGAAACTASICYRVPIAATVSVVGRQAFPGLAKTKAVLLADPRFVGGYDITRAPCVKKMTGLTITNGMLTKVDVDKPSEIVGCLSIPLEVLKKIFAVPSALFETETSRLKAEKGVIDAQANLLKSQAGLLEQQNEALSP